MAAPKLPDLSRRERQIMDYLFRRGPATAAEVQAGIRDAPSYSAIRAQLSTLEQKGHLRHHADGPRYVYEPVMRPEKARRSALRHLLETFFDGSAEAALAALLESRRHALTNEELDRLSQLINVARREGR